MIISERTKKILIHARRLVKLLILFLFFFYTLFCLNIYWISRLISKDLSLTDDKSIIFIFPVPTIEIKGSNDSTTGGDEFRLIEDKLVINSPGPPIAFTGPSGNITFNRSWGDITISRLRIDIPDQAKVNERRVIYATGYETGLSRIMYFADMVGNKDDFISFQKHLYLRFDIIERDVSLLYRIKRLIGWEVNHSSYQQLVEIDLQDPLASW